MVVCLENIYGVYIYIYSWTWGTQYVPPKYVVHHLLPSETCRFPGILHSQTRPGVVAKPFDAMDHHHWKEGQSRLQSVCKVGHPSCKLLYNPAFKTKYIYIYISIYLSTINKSSWSYKPALLARGPTLFYVWRLACHILPCSFPQFPGHDHSRPMLPALNVSPFLLHLHAWITSYLCLQVLPPRVDPSTFCGSV